jgi:hypothetical protein
VPVNPELRRESEGHEYLLMGNCWRYGIGEIAPEVYQLDQIRESCPDVLMMELTILASSEVGFCYKMHIDGSLGWDDGKHGLTLWPMLS